MAGLLRTRAPVIVVGGLTEQRVLQCATSVVREAQDRVTGANNYMSMLGFVTHELNAPLANVQSLANLLLEGLQNRNTKSKRGERTGTVSLRPGA